MLTFMHKIHMPFEVSPPWEGFVAHLTFESPHVCKKEMEFKSLNTDLNG